MKRLGSVVWIGCLLLALVGCGGSEPDGDVSADIAASEAEGDLPGEAGSDPVTAEGEPVDSNEAPRDSSAASLVSSAEIQRVSVLVYFPAASGNGLIGEVHEIFETKTPGDRIKQIVADLIEGPESKSALSALPRGTSLRQVYVLDSGVAYLDFSSELSSGLGGGSLRELLTLYSIIDSVVLNVSEVRKVGLLVGGRPVDSLNGHLDLRRPLGANRDLIIKG